VCCTQKGFTLVEMLIALAIGSLLLASLYNFYLTQKKTNDIREQIAEMQQNARGGMALIVREIRLAGYNPTGAPGVGITAAGSNTIRITMDLNENGNTNDTNEDITYSLYDPKGNGHLKLGRKALGGNNDPVVENVENLHLVYTLRDGSTTSTPASPSDIRLVHVSLTVRTTRPDPGYPTNGGYRTYTLKSVITPRNLAL
jgi:type IV pilus assembly protein PilW